MRAIRSIKGQALPKDIFSALDGCVDTKGYCEHSLVHIHASKIAALREWFSGIENGFEPTSIAAVSGLHRWRASGSKSGNNTPL